MIVLDCKRPRSIPVVGGLARNHCISMEGGKSAVFGFVGPFRSYFEASHALLCMA